MKLVIGNKNYSSWSLRPWLLLTYFDVKFEEERIALFTEEMKHKMSLYCPNSKVPVLIEKDFKVWDSLAICEYINETYINYQGWPKDAKQRAHARAISAEMHAGFLNIRQNLPMNIRRPVQTLTLSNATIKGIERIIEIWQSCLEQYGHAGKFLFGQFSIADAMFMPVVSRFNTYNVLVPPLVKDYIQDMLNLPAYEQWREAALAETEIIDQDEI